RQPRLCHPGSGVPRTRQLPQRATRQSTRAAITRPNRLRLSHFRAMDLDRFWELMDQARAAAGPAADQAVRDFDHPDDDPERDYWDFDELELDPEAMRAGPGFAETVDEREGALHDTAEADEDDEEDDNGPDELTDPVATALVGVLSTLDPAEIAG